MGGVGQGEGAPGTPIGTGGARATLRDRPGNTQGEHGLEVDISLQELAEMLGQELELPKH